MGVSKRFSGIFFTTLAVVLTSVFLFSSKVSAESIPLPVAEKIIQEQKQEVDSKANVLVETTQEIESLQNKKTTLATELETIKSDVEKLKQEMAEKKAAAEAERKRVEELKNMFVHVNRFATNSAGNLYAAGNCTWYAKSRRPDLPNNLGNANMWYSNASAQGWSVGSKPKKGAVGVSTDGWYGHVVYVEGVSLDGQKVTISEMNYRGLYSMNTRTVSYSDFQYIYELD